MSKQIPRITERVEDLQKRLKAEKDVRQRQRLEMLYLLRSGQAKPRKQVADFLGVHRHTIGSWPASIYPLKCYLMPIINSTKDFY